jgi:hypothetical protein
MIEHKGHATSISSQEADTMAECGDQFIKGAIEDIRENRAFDVAPEAFDEVEARRIWWQPENFNLVAMVRQP